MLMAVKKGMKSCPKEKKKAQDGRWGHAGNIGRLQVQYKKVGEGGVAWAILHGMKRNSGVYKKERGTMTAGRRSGDGLNKY